MLLASVLIVLGIQTKLYHTHVITSRSPSLGRNENAEFAEIIKQDLRKNNLDYLEHDTPNSDEDTKPNADITNQLFYQNNKVHRRNFETNSTKKARTYLEVTSPRFNVDLDKNIVSRYPKSLNKDKFMQFMDKNKGLVRDFMSKKIAESGRPGGQTMTTMAALLETMAMEMSTVPATRSKKARGRNERVQRANTDEEIRDSHRAPNAQQLDMAPAKGGRIHMLRVKNRLCHRHVLIPEGPKYDSKGAVYLAAFSPAPGKDYPKTRAPNLLLPKCCNCCKKSVLGCE